MIKVFSAILFAILVCSAFAKDRTVFVFQYNSASERTPLYTDPRFNITKNNYNQGANQLTLEGLRNSFGQGGAFKDLYTSHHDDFLSPWYEPTEYFVRSFPDNPSIMTAYSFMLGTNPPQVEGLGLIREKKDTAPLRDAHVDDTRRALYLDRPVDGAQPAFVHTGNSDGFFYRDIEKMYPGIKKDVDYNMNAAKQEFEQKHGEEFFYRLARMMNVAAEDIDFDNIAQYLDDYICAVANGKPTYPFNFDNEMKNYISEYYYFLINHGLLRDPALNKVIAHPLLYSMLREILFKAQDETEISRWEGPCVTSKVSLAFGNRLTYLAALRVLNIDKDIIYNPGWGDQLTIELFLRDGEWFVRVFNNNKVVALGTRTGDIPLDYFKAYICERLYFGNLDSVTNGFEDYHEKAGVKGQCDSMAKTVPLFGCKKKIEFNNAQNKKAEYGWTQTELRSNDIYRKYGGRAPVDDTIYFLAAKARTKQSGDYSYSYSSDSGSSSSDAPANGYSYSYSSGDSGASDASQNGGSYSYEYSSGSSGSSGSSSSSGSSGAAQSGQSTGGSYYTSGSSSSAQGGSKAAAQSKVLYDYADAKASQNTVKRVETNSNAAEKCPFAVVEKGFQEIARTEIDVAVKVKKPVTTYVEVEECQTVSIPTLKREFDLFRVAPVKVTQKKTINGVNDGYYREGYSGSNYNYDNEYKYTYTIEEPMTRDIDNPYLGQVYQATGYEYAGARPQVVSGGDYTGVSSRKGK